MECLSPDSLPTMDQYVAGDGDLLLGDSSELPLLSVQLLPIPVADVSVLESVTTPSVGEQFPVSSVVSPDLSREGPFDASKTASGSGAAPHVLDSLPGCQYRMTSYDTADRKEVDPAYGFQLHDPCFLEYVGAPESARLLSRAPGYWLHHMNRDRAILAALQLQHDAGIMMSNLQVIGQFVTSLKRISSEVMRLAFGQEQFQSEVIQSVTPSPRARQAAHYMAAMGLWRPYGSQGAPGPLPTSSCNDCILCDNCFPDLRK